ncbi:hypothetical protein FRX31_005727 [Thalictrum thalictroides]|uniref:RNase H type-1 domain-containing protein n=1 Tax=Thalictrum thalictroides TaxID=46969 RepID=A0A7J6X752_THATH|nr:hypothetical protein FRX31_005727 [Thalictrum thalictroides]
MTKMCLLELDIYIFGRYSQLPLFTGSNRHSASSAEEAEGLAIKKGLLCALSEGVHSLLLFSDNQIEAVNGNSDNLSWELNSLLMEIQELRKQLSFCLFR